MEFGLYVSPVKGFTVRRFGAPPNTYIGAKRVGKQMLWDEAKIVPIPENEARKYGAEYDGAIASGALKRRTAAEYAAQQEARAKARKERRAGAESAQAAPVAAAEPAQAEPTDDADATAPADGGSK